ncbi:8521_t:CDS:2, partial [Scutellospora calospora]
STQLEQTVKKRRSATSKELAETLNNVYFGLNIAPRTVRENFQNIGYKVMIPHAVSLLKKEAMIRRVLWVHYKSGELVPTRVVIKHPYKVHVWRAFYAKKTIGFHVFTGIMNGEQYHEILMNYLFDQANIALGDRWTFQQDNDPKHTAKLIKVLLEDQYPHVLN